MKTLLITGRNVGFFSLVLHTIDNCLSAAAEGLGVWVEWGPECCPYYAGRNIWEQLFEQPMLAERPDHFDAVSNDFGSPSGAGGGYGSQQLYWTCQYVNPPMRARYNAAMRRYVRLKPAIEAKARAFIDTLPPDYVCVHIRGTDRQNDAQMRPVAFYVGWLHAFQDRPIVVCCDTEEALAAVRRDRPDALAYNAVRRPDYGDTTAIHMPGLYDPYRIAEDVVVDWLIMANAGLLLHAGSNVSLAAWLWNADLKHQLALLHPKT